ncbi:MAG: hypothetical protein KKH52_04495 [Nanoarchaeota archaeon]|nr:hypothetical protein [Nanoarchaeota archaeon]
MQKAIRRNKPDIAGYFAIDLFMSGFKDYVWRRLLTISAEDCHDETITTEVYNLYRSYILITEKNDKLPKGRVFVAKAVIILCRTPKSRDADHLTNLVYDKDMLDETKLIEFLTELDDSDKKEVPDYTYDIHTKKGRIMGKTKKDFFTDEFNGLEPKQKGLFDNLI